MSTQPGPEWHETGWPGDWSKEVESVPELIVALREIPAGVDVVELTTGMFGFDDLTRITYSPERQKVTLS